MSIETNDGGKMATFEMDQYFDGPGNRAVTHFRSNGVEVRIYVDGNTNERVTHIPCCELCLNSEGYLFISRIYCFLCIIYNR